MSERHKHEFVWDGRGERGEDARLSVISGRAASDLRLAGLHFRILAHLGRFNHKRGWCRISQTDLAVMFGVRRQAINKALTELNKWAYVEKRDQQESHESFCLYRVALDRPEAATETEGGVSGKADTPPRRNRKGGVSGKADTPPGRVASGECTPGADTSVCSTRHPCPPGADTPHLIPRAHLHVGHIEKVDPQPVHSIFKPGAGDRLIPFEGTDGACDDGLMPVSYVTEAVGRGVDPKKIGSPVQALLEIGKQPNVDTSERLKGFTFDVLRKVQMLGVATEPLLAHYAAKTAGKAIKDPAAYLLRMAREEAAKSLGVSVDALKGIFARDPIARAKATEGALAGDDALDPDAIAKRVKAGYATDWRERERRKAPKRTAA
jgi:hypothetical protein